MIRGNNLSLYNLLKIKKDYLYGERNNDLRERRDQKLMLDFSQAD